MDGFNDKDFERFLQGLMSGDIDPRHLPTDLYFAIGKDLQKGLFQGFGSNISQFQQGDEELFTELRNNVWMFSAAKTYQEVRDISAEMFDENGFMRSESEFARIARDKFDLWNDSWGRSEYVTAVGQAQSAVKWTQIERDADQLPILVFDTVGQACPECAPYNGFSAKVDDPVWSWLMPLLHFNCRCIVRQEEGDYELSDADAYNQVISSRGNISQEFQMNPGKDGYIFSPKHPYFDVAPRDRSFAKRNFDMPIPTAKETAR